MKALSGHIQWLRMFVCGELADMDPEAAKQLALDELIAIEAIAEALPNISEEALGLPPMNRRRPPERVAFVPGLTEPPAGSDAVSCPHDIPRELCMECRRIFVERDGVRIEIPRLMSYGFRSREDIIREQEREPPPPFPPAEVLTAMETDHNLRLAAEAVRAIEEDAGDNAKGFGPY